MNAGIGDGREELSSPDTCDESGDAEMRPRIGDQYQAEIPSLSPCSEPDSVGLDIPITWIGESRNGSANLKTGVSEERKNLCPVPGFTSDEWTETEEDSFLLGIYVFGKNLFQVRKFMGTKKTGDLLSFYYGKFYKSEKYLRWVACRRSKTRKSAHGQRIFTGVRQQEFLLRLLPHLSTENEAHILKVSKCFGEGKMDLEEYVMTVKSTVGMETLIDVVGIGKPQGDLTQRMAESVKPNPQQRCCPARPPGTKPSSTLTTDEIVSCLTGDFRLSKTRSNDIFWEAVWPRLLAKGWNSELPTTDETRKKSLVFLVPGVKKFSNRKLTKGAHYFDCIADVLGMVAADPSLLDIDGAPRPRTSVRYTVLDTSSAARFRSRQISTDGASADDDATDADDSGDDGDGGGDGSTDRSSTVSSENQQPDFCCSSSPAEWNAGIDLNLPRHPAENSSEMEMADGRRHSTRNRPLTARALEALAYDYVPVTKKRKRMSPTRSSGKRPRSVEQAESVVCNSN